MQFLSCDFTVKDKDGNKIKFDFDKENLLTNKELDKLLKNYTTSLDAVGIEDIEDGQITEMQKQKILKGLINSRSIAAQITEYVKNYVSGLKKLPKDCSGFVEKLEEADTKLDTVIKIFSTYDTQKATMDNPFKLLGVSTNFAGYVMHLYNARMTCAGTIEHLNNNN